MSSLSANQPFAARLPALADWYAGPVGQRVWVSEKRLLDYHLASLFGYHLMSLGVCPALPLADASPIHHRFALSPAPADGIGVCASLHSLPIDSESVDVAVLHHSLDYSEDPHQLLRETARVLMPFGHVLIFGFQRWSALGMQQWLRAGMGQDAVAAHDFLGVLRLHDWLKLLDFEILKSRHTVFVPPQWPEKLRERLQWFERFAWGSQLPFGSVYFVLARKTVTGGRALPLPRERVRLRNPLAVLAPPAAAPSRGNSRRKPVLH